MTKNYKPANILANFTSNYSQSYKKLEALTMKLFIFLMIFIAMLNEAKAQQNIDTTIIERLYDPVGFYPIMVTGSYIRSVGEFGPYIQHNKQTQFVGGMGLEISTLPHSVFGFVSFDFFPITLKYSQANGLCLTTSIGHTFFNEAVWEQKIVNSVLVSSYASYSWLRVRLLYDAKSNLLYAKNVEDAKGIGIRNDGKLLSLKISWESGGGKGYTPIVAHDWGNTPKWAFGIESEYHYGIFFQMGKFLQNNSYQLSAGVETSLPSFWPF